MAAVSARGATASRASPRSFGSPAPKCTRCEASVFLPERVVGPGSKTYHKWCLKCTSCHKTLDQGSVLDHDAEPFCKPCHSRNFGPKGVGYGGAMGGDYVDRYSPVAKKVAAAVTTRSSTDILADAQAAINSPVRRTAALREDSYGIHRTSSPLRESMDISPNKPAYDPLRPASSPVKAFRVDSPRTTAMPLTGSPKTSFRAGTPDRCRRCGDVVYHAEQALAAGHKWHKRCLRCAQCSKTLDSHLTVSNDDSLPYCKTCHAKKSGIADQGFALRPSMF